MRLRTWIENNGLSQQAFAEMVGVHVVTVSKWVNAKMAPRRARMAKIQEITSGDVTANDFMSWIDTKSEAA